MRRRLWYRESLRLFLLVRIIKCNDVRSCRVYILIIFALFGTFKGLLTARSSRLEAPSSLWRPDLFNKAANRRRSWLFVLPRLYCRLQIYHSLLQLCVLLLSFALHDTFSLLVLQLLHHLSLLFYLANIFWLVDLGENLGFFSHGLATNPQIRLATTF